MVKRIRSATISFCRSFHEYRELSQLLANDEFPAFLARTLKGFGTRYLVTYAVNTDEIVVRELDGMRVSREWRYPDDQRQTNPTFRGQGVQTMLLSTSFDGIKWDLERMYECSAANTRATREYLDQTDRLIDEMSRPGGVSRSEIDRTVAEYEQTKKDYNATACAHKELVKVRKRIKDNQ